MRRSASPSRLRALATMLRRPQVDEVTYLLLQNGDRHDLAGLVPHVGTDLDRRWRRTFGHGLSTVHAGPERIARHLDALAAHGCEDPCACGLDRTVDAEVVPFAHALTAVTDPFYRRVGELLLASVGAEIPTSAFESAHP